MSSQRFSFTRFLSLFKKEVMEIARDRSILVIGLGLPVLMLFIFGWGVSMDMERIPAAVVLEERTPAALSFVRDLSANPSFDVRTFAERPEAERALEDRSVEFILSIRPGFSEDLARGEGVVGLTLYGVDSNSAVLFRNFVSGVLAQSALKQQRLSADSSTDAALPMGSAASAPVVTMSARSWFNDAGISRWYLVPGLLVVVSCVSASFMGSLVIAREWERGTMTSLYSTPASSLEILFAKVLPYAVISLSGFLLCFALAIILFNEPFRGSLALFFLTAFVFVAWAALLGILISAKTKSQFLATEAAVMASFMPGLMLSGFLFDLRSVPVWIEFVRRLLPPTYAVESFKICFLSGGNVETLLRNLCVILLWSAAIGVLALKELRKRESVPGAKAKTLPTPPKNREGGAA